MELDYKKLGERVRTARENAGLKQEQLATAINMTSQHISHVETNNTKISLPTLVKIANALNTSLDKLVSDSLSDSKPQLLEDVQKVFADTNSNEMYVMLKSAQSIKEAMRIRNLSDDK